MERQYKLRCTAIGHESDVRSVCVTNYPEGAILSGSRDVTARIWVPNQGDVGFSETHTMRGHSNFVSCVCVLPADEEFPTGLVITGSNDNTILAFTLDSSEPVFKLTGHANTVCALGAGKFGTLLSGSWDMTAKVWLKRKCVMTLTGHQAAVWAVALMPQGGIMLSASADKTIRMWRAGKCERTFTGHTDCVRGLAVLSPTDFLSCANDATVRQWRVDSAACLRSFCGHENYVYDVAVSGDGRLFATVGEDRSLRVWHSGGGQTDAIQTLTHPAQSVWTVCFLDNGDIVTGASDGVIRVFTQSEERTAPEDVIAAYDEGVASSAIPGQIGDVKVDSLPGVEALFNPGKKDGQTLMIKDEGSAHAYQWSSAEGRWVKIGAIVGGSGGSQGASGKQLYEGQEYDYVFDVDIQEDQPALKLPYNVSDDPWMAAHNFLGANQLSQTYLEQVVKFIEQQTQGRTLGGGAAAATSDPFTGGNRYVPGSGATAPSAAPTSDPFTGGGRYIPGEQPAPGGAPPTSDPFTGAGRYQPDYSGSNTSTGKAGAGDPAQSVDFFPKTSFLTFESGNISAVIEKLKQFNASQPEKVDESSLSGLESVMSGSSQPTAVQLDLMWTLLQWPQDVLFPALDMLRLSLRHAAVASHFFGVRTAFLPHILTIVTQSDGPPANRMLALRALCNAFATAERAMTSSLEDVLTAAAACRADDSRAIQVARSSVLLNYAVTCHRQAAAAPAARCLDVCAAVAARQTDAEANFRLLVAVGTLLAVGGTKAPDAAIEFAKRCQLVNEPTKVRDCAENVLKVMQ